ncbi:heterokaryon incompatibility protein-domain-containing protein [Podospora didyma]|uniref:Heterokaryon incompatibility protein-domain-containing protein n=1 Tax=Podospora didyma TaxID=330526 RepID=A0AAE0NHK3_9PEZI|nr:heterokaryon incompatibility protein-domain-containing protein [Podospora didyma]
MMLINTITLKLEEFFGTIPDYAILSHAWAGGEVSFEEFMQCRPALQATQGFAKIAAACDKARSHGMAYCWVDTCCIDKSSSADLSESTNSMFNWYRKSQACYVFLADFDLDVDAEESVASRIAKCRWFTRGWCLQELIAPTHLRFYDCKWRCFGTKESLRKYISEISGVAQDILNDSSHLHTVPVAKRMSWSSRRNERVEDMAYSLLGIFDINMPMLYGEGDKAFIRL